MFAFACKLFHEDFSPIDGTLHGTWRYKYIYIYIYVHGICTDFNSNLVNAPLRLKVDINFTYFSTLFILFNLIVFCRLSKFYLLSFLNNYASENIALGKPTFQSSIEYNGDSSKAVDGDRTTNFQAGSCTHTLSGKRAWWAVDLEQRYLISRVGITNRGDCCGEF